MKIQMIIALALLGLTFVFTLSEGAPQAPATPAPAVAPAPVPAVMPAAPGVNCNRNGQGRQFGGGQQNPGTGRQAREVGDLSEMLEDDSPLNLSIENREADERANYGQYFYWKRVQNQFAQFQKVAYKKLQDGKKTNESSEEDDDKAKATTKAQPKPAVIPTRTTKMYTD